MAYQSLRPEGTPRPSQLTLPIDDRAELLIGASTLPRRLGPAAAKAGPTRSRRPHRRSWRLWLYGSAALFLISAGGGLARLVGPGEKPVQELPERLEAERAALWSAIEEAGRARDWTRSAARARQLLQLPESQAFPAGRSREALETALDEGRNLLVYDRFLQAAARRAPDAAVLTYAELTPGSVYRELAAPRYLEAQAEFARIHLERAKSELERLGCRAALPHLDAVLVVAPETRAAPEVQAIRGRCRPSAELQARSAPPAPRPTTARHAAPASPQAEAKVAPMEDAQQAYISGNYRLAIRIAQQHTGSDAGRAWRVIGGAACYLGDEGLIRKTLAHLDDPAQQFVLRVCQRNGFVP